MNITILDRYLLADDFDELASSLNFPPEVWNVAAVLGDVTSPTSPFELEQLTGQNADQIEEALKRLLAEKLVRQCVITWKEFSESRETYRSSIAEASALRRKQTAPMYGGPARPSPDGVAVRLGNMPQQGAASGTNAWMRQSPDTVRVGASPQGATVAFSMGGRPSGQPSGRLLRPLMAQIEDIKGGGVEGQLLVYQVFLRVPFQLLQDEGIMSLHFVDDQTVIHNPALYTAIVKAAKDVTGIDLK